MKTEEIVNKRAAGTCELCKSTETLNIYEVISTNGTTEENCIMICAKCKAQVDKKEELESKHWRCLTASMWSEVPGIQVVAWRMLNRLRNESWATDNLEMLYLDDEKLAWAKTTGDHESDGSVDLHKDSNGHVLQNGDSVILIKSLDVKASAVNAKLGTVVRNIRLVENNTEQIEGRIEGQVIVILTKYLRKQH
ncbi:MAG: PhnA domain-containing protein [Chitinophagaceae bacterium]